MDKNYFVSIKGNRIACNLTNKQATDIAIKQHNNNPELCGLDIGIGRIKYINGIKHYSMIPYFYNL